MPDYDIIAFRDDLSLPDGDEIVAADVNPPNERQRSFALVRRGSTNNEETYLCGGGENNDCQRSVSGPDERCWQHEDDE